MSETIGTGKLLCVAGTSALIGALAATGIIAVAALLMMGQAEPHRAMPRIMPGQPEHHAAPVQPAQPVRPAQPVQPSQPSQPNQPGQGTPRSAQPHQPADNSAPR